MAEMSAGRSAETDALVALLVEHFPHGYVCGADCDHHMNSPEGWAEHVAALMGSIQSDASAQTYGNRDLSAEQHHPSTRSHPTKSKSAGDQE